MLGNEGYGSWETDQHSDPHMPQSYATNVKPYLQAMHAVDPNARLGFPMTINRDMSGGTGTWVADPDLWNKTILCQNQSEINWIDFHWYPVFGIPVLSNRRASSTGSGFRARWTTCAASIEQCGTTIPITVSESNISQSEIVYNAQPVAALYAAATALKCLSKGAAGYMWWQVFNSDNMNGDFGFLSDATGTPGPSGDDHFPPPWPPGRATSR